MRTARPTFTAGSRPAAMKRRTVTGESLSSWAVSCTVNSSIAILLFLTLIVLD
jgi:hypothetical protein